MKVSVDADSCAGHGACAAACPEVFAITDDGYAATTLSIISPELRGAVNEAAESCPERAIHIE